jgi:hypothetical protein
MNTLVSLLLLLYPRWWRQRYEEELRALSEEARFHAFDYLDIVGSALGVRMNKLSGMPAWKLLVTFVVFGALAGAGMTALWPRKYYSSAVFRLEPAERQGAATTEDIVKSATASATLEQIIRANRVYGGTSMSEADKVASLKRAIAITLVGPGRNTIMVQFVASSAIDAQRVTSALVEAIKAASTSSFQLVEPPSLNKDPISPNVLNLILTGAIAGLLCGAFVVAITMRVRREPPLRHA